MVALPPRQLFEDAILAASSATLKLVFLVMIGVAATYKGVFNERGISDMGRLIYNLSLPALVFSNIITEVTLEKLFTLWKLPCVAVLHVTTAFLLAKLLSSICRLKGVEEKAVKLCLMFGNCGALSIALIDTLCDDEPLASLVGSACTVRGVEYISFYLIAQNVMMFTWAEEIVKDHSDEEGEEDELDFLQTAASQETVPELKGLLPSKQKSPGVGMIEQSPRMAPSFRQQVVESQRPKPMGGHYHSLSTAALSKMDDTSDKNGAVRLNRTLSTPRMSGSMRRRHSIDLMDQYTLHSIISRYPVDVMPRPIVPDPPAAFDDDGIGPEELALGPPAVRPSQKPGSAARALSCVLNFGWAFWTLLTRIFSNPTIRAAMLAFVLGVIPPIKALFVGPGETPLSPMLAAIQILGQAQVPCSMLMLSGSGTIRFLNSKAAKEDEVTLKNFTFSGRAVSCIIIGRVLLFPIIGLLWWWGLFSWGLLANTPVLSLVVLLDAAVPTAQNVVMLLLVHGHPEHGHALAYVILWQYACAIPTLILNTALYLAIVRMAYP